MLISNAIARALDEVGVREREAIEAFAPQNCYFVTRAQSGSTLYTRGGMFALRDGGLVDERDRPILGYADAGSALEPLRAHPVDDALGLTQSARVEADGSLVYDRPTIDPRTGEREVQRSLVGRVALARFAPGTKLQPVDLQIVAAPSSVTPHIGTPSDGNFAALERLQDAYIALDALRAAGVADAGLQKTAMDLLK